MNSGLVFLLERVPQFILKCLIIILMTNELGHDPATSPLDNPADFDARTRALALVHLKTIEDSTFIAG